MAKDLFAAHCMCVCVMFTG